MYPSKGNYLNPNLNFKHQNFKNALSLKRVFPSYVCRPRSRGKTAVEDEDSMDGLEAAETENTVETGNESIVLMLPAY